MPARDDLQRMRRFARRFAAHDPEAPVPPPLPPATVMAVPERGGMFVRQFAGPPHAPAVLLLHGWTASADLNWVLAYDLLADSYRLIAPDHRGHRPGIRAEQPVRL